MFKIGRRKSDLKTSYANLCLAEDFEILTPSVYDISMYPFESFPRLKFGFAKERTIVRAMNKHFL
jgi:hypothetical protein